MKCVSQVTPVYIYDQRRSGPRPGPGARIVRPQSQSLGAFSKTPTIRQQGDFVIIENDWCPELRKVNSETCVAYEPNEIQISRTEAGHLTPAVVLVPAGLPGPNV